VLTRHLADHAGAPEIVLQPNQTATDFARCDAWLVLVISLVLKAIRGKTAPTPHSNGFSEGTGRYRQQLGRGDAD